MKSIHPNPSKYDKKIQRIMIMALVAFIIFCIFLLLSQFSRELLGLKPDYMPHQIEFGTFYLVPLNFIAIFLAFIVIYKSLRIWKYVQQRTKIVTALLLVSPLFIYWINNLLTVVNLE